MGLWHKKIPVEVVKLGTGAVGIVSGIAPKEGDQLISK